MPIKNIKYIKTTNNNSNKFKMKIIKKMVKKKINKNQSVKVYFKN